MKMYDISYRKSIVSNSVIVVIVIWTRSFNYLTVKTPCVYERFASCSFAISYFSQILSVSTNHYQTYTRTTNKSSVASAYCLT